MRARLYLACTWIEAVFVLGTRRLRCMLRIGRPPQTWDRFLKLFVLHERRRQPRLIITCSERTDGAGAQAHTIIAAMAFARAFGHQYRHTPFLEIDHADRPMGEWVAAWEELFNLGEGEAPCEPGRAGVLNYSSFHPRLYHVVCRALQRAGSSYFQPFFYRSDLEPESYRPLIADLQRKYRHGRPPVRNPVITVAVHMRRGDVTSAHRERHTSVEAVCRTVRELRAALDVSGEPYSISLYSQGETGEFAGLAGEGARLFLGADALWTMRQLIDADILVMSKSSFSYVPALISGGIKLYEPFWHSPLAGWIVCNSGGGFSRELFDRQLAALREQRQRDSGPSI